jgi:hypothetical protein
MAMIRRFKLLICRGQSGRLAGFRILAAIFGPAAPAEIYNALTINVPSSFAQAAESDTRAP